jgi:hypothetical protein
MESISGRISVVLILCVAACGCGGEQSRFIETKRVDEKVTEAELKAFVRVVRSLPNDTLPEMPAFFAPPPDWNQSRTLPVGELVKEEQTLISERSSPEWLARRLQKNRPLGRALRRERMSVEQFVGFSLAVGVALARNTLDDTRHLDKVLKKGYVTVERLKSDTRPFSSLRRDGRHSVLQQAAWITRIDRIEKLTKVPPENIALVQSHLDILQPMFPEEFNSNPLLAVVDRLEEQGLPFEEISEGGSDAEIEWDPQDANIGHDRPDAEFRNSDQTAGTAMSGFPANN